MHMMQNIYELEVDALFLIADNQAEYKQLRGGVVFVAAIPKSPSGKILRKNILQSIMESV